MKFTTLSLVFVVGVSAVYAQSNPLVTEMKANYNQIKNNVLRGAEKMPEADYTFKPAPESRTFGCRRLLSW